MNYTTDTEPGSSGSPVLNDDQEKMAMREIEKVLRNIKPSLHESINLTTIKDIESRLSNLEEKVNHIFKILDSKKEQKKMNPGF